ARVLVFKLGGDETLPPFEAVTQMPPEPPPLRASEDQIERGAALFAETCALCHGQNAVGGQKDLRFMEQETHDNFLSIVLEGVLEENGMASFADVLNEEQARDIHGYLISRAHEAWGQEFPEEE